MGASALFWRRTDVEGFERLELIVEPDGVTATSSVICLEAGGFRLDHWWKLDPAWRAQAVTVELWSDAGLSPPSRKQQASSRMHDYFGAQLGKWETTGMGAKPM